MWLDAQFAVRYFYPRPPRGGRRHFCFYENFTQVFLSTPSAGRATNPAEPRKVGQGISIHALRGEGDLLLVTLKISSTKFLSTPSAGRATEHQRRKRRLQDISIHALRGEGDGRLLQKATPTGHFYPRPPRGGRHASPGVFFPLEKYFYPRPPRGGRQVGLGVRTPGIVDFYPRPPRGGRPVVGQENKSGQSISIHALRGEGDWRSAL